jgi:hypothetical protein
MLRSAWPCPSAFCAGCRSGRCDNRLHLRRSDWIELRLPAWPHAWPRWPMPLQGNDSAGSGVTTDVIDRVRWRDRDPSHVSVHRAVGVSPHAACRAPTRGSYGSRAGAGADHGLGRCALPAPAPVSGDRCAPRGDERSPCTALAISLFTRIFTVPYCFTALLHTWKTCGSNHW